MEGFLVQAWAKNAAFRNLLHPQRTCGKMGSVRVSDSSKDGIR